VDCCVTVGELAAAADEDDDDEAEVDDDEADAAGEVAWDTVVTVPAVEPDEAVPAVVAANA
jgi:hypothetical protein